MASCSQDRKSIAFRRQRIFEPDEQEDRFCWGFGGMKNWNAHACMEGPGGASCDDRH
jgi:Fe-S oxidoreductase